MEVNQHACWFRLFLLIFSTCVAWLWNHRSSVRIKAVFDYFVVRRLADWRQLCWWWCAIMMMRNYQYKLQSFSSIFGPEIEGLETFTSGSSTVCLQSSYVSAKLKHTFRAKSFFKSWLHKIIALELLNCKRLFEFFSKISQTETHLSAKFRNFWLSQQLIRANKLIYRWLTHWCHIRNSKTGPNFEKSLRLKYLT